MKTRICSPLCAGSEPAECRRTSILDGLPLKRLVCLGLSVCVLQGFMLLKPLNAHSKETLFFFFFLQGPALHLQQ